MTLIVGVVIGAGIFKAPSMVAAMTGSTAWMFGAWLLGGLISLIGAFCYAELATSCPDAGGDYYFLKRAYGMSVSFLLGWARFLVITTGSIALLAFVFGDYMNQVLPLGAAGAAWGPPLYAVVAIAVLSWVNLQGIRSGCFAQTWLTGLEVAGLLLTGKVWGCRAWRNRRRWLPTCFRPLLARWVKRSLPCWWPSRRSLP